MKARAVEGTSTGAGDDDGTASGSRREWLRYVQAEGEASATVDPNARYISDRNVVAPKETRRAANVIRSNGDSTGDDPLATRVAPTAAPEVGLAAPPPPAEPPAASASASASPSTAVAQASASRSASRPASRAAPPTPAPAKNAAGGAPRAIATPKEVTLPYVSPAADGGQGGGAGVAIGAVPDPAPVRADVATTTPPPRRTRPVRTATSPTRTPVTTPSPVATPAPPITARSTPIEDDFWASEPLPLDTPDLDEEDEDAPDSALLDVVTAKAAGWSDLAVLDERVALGDKTRFSAKAHPLGAWMRGVDDELRRRWTYPETFRALGIKGNVVVEFRVERTGVVDNVRVTVSSNIPELDLAALSSLPKRFAPPPGGRRVQLQYVFRYRQDQR